ncbi:ABC transporter substrate-binding protein [Oceanobacter mangrovi]|uniref:ABC transporter substrate-binding protein n=1 Tax=Oceanobacter mangrovi TaxID=2862510 RepID=UPI001C8E3233|nr:ABC transporter substrate-binding protein [Oceanobacter mangrovi]
MNKNNIKARTSTAWLAIPLCLLLLGGWPDRLIARAAAEQPLLIGMTYPNTGRYRQTGIDQARGALLAIDEINASGGINGRMLQLQPGGKGRQGTEQQQVDELVEAGVAMAFGGSLTPEVTARAAASHQLLYFDTHFHSPSERIRDPLVFYEATDSWMAAKALAFYINQQLRGRKLYYVSSDNQWGAMSEGILRRFISSTEVAGSNRSMTRFPNPRRREFQQAFEQALAQGAKVLVLVQSGDDLAKALQIAQEMNLQGSMTLVAPNISLAVARAVGAEGLEGVIATVPWSWQVARDYHYQAGEAFTAHFLERFQTHPSASAASAWSVVWQYALAARDLGSTDAKRLAHYLRGKNYTALKDPQRWRELDQISVQSMYVVQGKSREQVLQGALREDYFRVVSDVPGQVLVLTEEELRNKVWQQQLSQEQLAQEQD